MYVIRLTYFRKDLSDRSCESGFSMIDVTNGSNVDMRLISYVCAQLVTLYMNPRLRQAFLDRQRDRESVLNQHTNM